MILADSSVWINHFRQGDPHLEQALLDNQILMHPFVLGEIACGNIHRRPQVLSDLQRISWVVCAEHQEVLHLLEQHRLFGQGIGWIDAHLLASALLSRCRLWTLDSRLQEAAKRLKLGYSGLI